MFDTYTRNMFLTTYTPEQLATTLARIEDIIFNAHFDNTDNVEFQNLIAQINQVL